MIFSDKKFIGAKMFFSAKTFICAKMKMKISRNNLWPKKVLAESGIDP